MSTTTPAAQSELDERIAGAFPGLPPSRIPALRAMCARFGINPDPAHMPRELAAVRAYGFDDDPEDSPSIVIVTCGGVKLRWPLDDVRDGSVERLRMIFKVKEGRPLPEDLRLPAVYRHGQVAPKPAA